jgi:hypothetical protein
MGLIDLTGMMDEVGRKLQTSILDELSILSSLSNLSRVEETRGR